MTTNRSFRIHGPQGMFAHAIEAIAERASLHALHRPRTVAAHVPVTEIMSRHVVCALPDLPLATLIDVMVTERIGCVPVVDETARPLGMVTKFDIVEQLTGPSEPTARLVGDVMMPLAITLDEKATVAHAAALMTSEDMHHVMIVSERRLVGVVSTMDITRWLFNNDGTPP